MTDIERTPLPQHIQDRMDEIFDGEAADRWAALAAEFNTRNKPRRRTWWDWFLGIWK